jgi:hypothetical protein
LTQDIENKVAVLVTGLLAAQYVVDVQDVVTLLIIVTVVLDAFAGFGKDAARVPGGFVLEVWIAYSICRWQMGRESLQGANETALGIGSAVGRL